MVKRVAAAVLAMAGASSLGWAQIPAGPEFHVNTFTTGIQGSPVVAADAGGNYVVVWSGDEDGSFSGIFGQRYDAAGAPLGGEFRVNTFTTVSQYEPAVASDTRGNFVVVWTDAGQDGYLSGVFGQRFDASGAPVGSEFPVNTFTFYSQRSPSVAMDADGDFVVAWQSDLQDGNGLGVFARLFDAAGTPAGPEFLVNTYTSGAQSLPAVSADADGDFVVVWQSYLQDGSGQGVFAQRFNAAGAAQGVEFRVNSSTNYNQGTPAVASDPSGNFLVAWAQTGGIIFFGAVNARHFDATGAPRAPEFTRMVFSPVAGPPAVSFDGVGNSVLAFEAPGPSGNDINGQRFNTSGGTREASSFVVNTYSSGNQNAPAVALDAVGNFLVAWQSDVQEPDGGGAGVYAQRFGGLLSAALAVDSVTSGISDGNGVFEAGEWAFVEPSWRNVNGLSQTFAGNAAGFSGPAGSFYSLIDDEADYGTVANGATGSCASAGNCYLLAISAPGSRPQRHWDARFRESILPDTQGQMKVRPLHIGDSFTDVLRSNGFYRGIETLLHHGVTSGCGLSGDRLLYCPGQSTTREQMAKFVLVSKEGADYQPPVCDPSDPRTFADVPDTNGFCPFIEELFRRGVVNGCALSPLRYCPQGTVTREQMAKFVLATLDPALVPSPCSPGNEVFADVPAGNGFCPFVEELSDRGVVSGCATNPLRYCPTAPVTREQMSKFLGLTFGLELYGP